jgi:peptide/nickel transport system substrate-binding protein
VVPQGRRGLQQRAQGVHTHAGDHHAVLEHLEVPLLRGRAAALALAACAALLPGASAAQAARHPYTIAHVLRYATGEDIVGLNPHLNQQLTLAYMASMTMAWLVRYDHRNRPVPELATELPSRANGGISADGKTITYHLRRDAKWSDGAPFTADDVRFSADVVRNPANNEGTHVGFDEIVRVDTPDPYTVVFRLRRPYSGFYVNFFSSGGANPCILPKHLLGTLPTINDAPYNALPVGIGPFKYVSWKRADSVEMVPDPLYFGRKPKLQRVIFKVIPDRNTTLTQLTTHEIDLWANVPAAYYDRARAIPGVTVLRQSSYAFNHLDFQMQHDVLRDAAVRRALRLGIDRATIRAKIRHGLGILQETPFGPGHPLHVDVPRVPFDIAEANRLLDAAGWRRGPDGVRAKDGRRLELTVVSVSGVPDNDALLEIVRPAWDQLGVRFEVRHYPSPLFFAPAQTGGILYSGKFDLAIFGWTTNPNGDLTNLYACDRVPPRGQNIPRYCDPATDRALRRFLATYDPAEQRAASRAVQERLVADVPTVVLDSREDVYASNSDLHGFHPNQVTAFDDLVDADI